MKLNECSIESKAELADLALKYMGYPSLKAKNSKQGMDESGFDCSGFVRFLLDQVNFPGLKGIRYANEFFDKFGVLIHPEAVDKGDLIFVSRNGIRPTHIGIMISSEEYISSRGVTNGVVRISPLKNRKIISSLPSQIYFHNPIGFKRLAIKEGRYQRLFD